MKLAVFFVESFRYTYSLIDIIYTGCKARNQLVFAVDEWEKRKTDALGQGLVSNAGEGRVGNRDAPAKCI